jgi:hypothetical protein
MTRAGLLLAVSAAVLPALVRAEDDAACARFEEPLAYNACLATHGPKANLGSATGGAARQIEPDGAAPVGGAPVEAPRRAHGAAAVTRRHARIHMEFRLR